MGSPLGVLFANFYMGTIEKRVMQRLLERPEIYCRYIDDIFVVVRNEEQLRELKEIFESLSCLNFTYELPNEDSLPFLDVLVKKEENRYMTSVYTKSTNLGLCMNGKSECPDRYRKSVISAYVRRAVTHCSSWTSVHQELQRVSQVLVNNGHSSDEIQRCINKQMRNFNETPLPSGNSRPPVL